MRFFACFIIFILSFVIGNQSQAVNDGAPYCKLSAGLMQYFPMKGELYDTSADKKQKATPVIEVGAGYNINSFIKADIFYKNSRLSIFAKTCTNRMLPSTTSKQKIQTHAMLMQIYLSSDKTAGSFCPFVVAGGGVGYNQTSDLTKTGFGPPMKYAAKNTINFIWTAGAGVIFSGISRDYSVELSYIYSHFGKIKVSRRLRSDSAQTSDNVPQGYCATKITAHQINISLNLYL